MSQQVYSIFDNLIWSTSLSDTIPLKRNYYKNTAGVYIDTLYCKILLNIAFSVDKNYSKVYSFLNFYRTSFTEGMCLSISFILAAKKRQTKLINFNSSCFTWQVEKTESSIAIDKCLVIS